MALPRTAVRHLLPLAVASSLTAPLLAGPARADTLYDAMIMAYRNNPNLQDARAAVRVADEEVPIALSGWRPNLSITADAGKSRSNAETTPRQRLEPRSLSLELRQSIYSGGRTVASTARAEAEVRSARERLRAAEQNVLLAAVTVYVDVLRDAGTLKLKQNNENVLSEQRRAAVDKLEAGQVTGTDVSQAEARLAVATADRISAEGDLAVSRASYERVVGKPPKDLQDVPLLPPLPKDLTEALQLALDRNPSLTEAKSNEKSADQDVQIQLGGLLPSVDLIGQVVESEEANFENRRSDEQSLRIRGVIPLYQSGQAHAQVRRSKETRNQRRIQIEVVRRSVIELTTQAWQKLVTARSNIVARKKAIQANESAANGVREEAKVGLRTVLDVLDAEQELLDSRVALIGAKRDEYVAAYQLLAATGGVDAASLKLVTKRYEPSVHYEQVRNKWFGWSVPE